MALPIQSPCFAKKPSPSLLYPSPCFPARVRLTVRAEASQNKSLTESTPEQASILAASKKANTTGLGFGSSTLDKTKEKEGANDTSSTAKKKKKNKKGRERTSSIIRRSPLEKPAFLSQQGEAQSQEQRKNESAFLLTWLGLGSLILIEGIVLAASGFLPEEWDKFFVKYLYPSFTPTVFLFVGGTVAYGVLKYLQSEKTKR
ncbi:PREDICTED: protein LOW PSII ACCUMULATION 2, chloroplastic [Nelumbo nucifera]|uniref:Protein LOW PSII ACCUMULATION 2, chloroplastic n=1 Tax=Nelumbo nucifera TaxID=4432 RepID=A0A1U8BIN7_NELNU|nr:PREDICTED: protein LOW PSII ACCUMULATION 2, chloroplastic [Nelumbo nucifera]